MLHPDLAELLERRIRIIEDLAFRDRDPDAHLNALREVSEAISGWLASHRGTLPARLDHFLSGCSYEKALRYLRSDGQWSGH